MGAGSGLRRMGAFLVCLLLLAAPRGIRADDEPEAEDLTHRCTLSCTGASQGMAAVLTDGSLHTSCRLEPGDALALRAEEDLGTLHLRLCQFESEFLLLEQGPRGGLLGMRAVKTDAILLNVPLTAGCRRVQILPLGEGVSLSEVKIFGPGPLPADVPAPAPPLTKADFLLVSTHPDDEWVYLGGVYPIYGGERGYAGTVVYMTLPNWERAHESIDGLWIGGLRTHPFFLGFADVRKNAPQREKDAVKREDVTLAMVRLYRQIRPLVVVTQDPENGEYGHWQHKLSAGVAYDAVQLAADPDYDPESAARYGPWTVQKLYQHFAQGMSALELDVDAPLSRYGGRSALEVARAAFKAHKTQQKTKYRPGARDRTKGDIVHFGLTWSAVGPDTGADLFEHIPEEALAANLKPAPTSEPPTPAPSATPAPSDAPTPAASAAPTFSPTAAPTVSDWDRVEKTTRWAADRAELLSAGLVLLAALLVVWKQYRRFRH